VRPKPRAVLVAALLLFLALAGQAAASNGGFAPVAPASPNAKRISDAYYLILGFTGVVFVLVEGALILFIIRFRSRGRGREVEGPQIRGNTNLEIGWTVVPVLVLAGIAAFIFYELPGIKNVPSAKAGNQLAITVEAHQFYWQFDYPDGQISIDRMVVPRGRVVTLEVVSSDVAHSWWIPALGGKIDAIPGRTNHTWFKASKAGVYSGQCAELCGIQHAAMKASVEVVTEGAYQRFLAAHVVPSRTVGEEMWTGGCAKCHGLAGEGYIGPPIAGNPVFNDKKALTTILKEGVAPNRTVQGMPAVGEDWSAAEIASLQRYIRTNPTLRAPSGR
jgi:cytochrome c oxidase subunit 2